jgi:hypothetical protein
VFRFRPVSCGQNIALSCDGSSHLFFMSLTDTESMANEDESWLDIMFWDGEKT